MSIPNDMLVKSNKTLIDNVLKDVTIKPILESLVLRTTRIVTHTYFFLKLYLLHLFKEKKPFPVLDRKFICHVFRVITLGKYNSGRYTIDNVPEHLSTSTLIKFYTDHYSETMVKDEMLYFDKLGYILAYEAIDIITNISNNIKQNFINHLNKYINVVFNVKKRRSDITNQTKDLDVRKKLYKDLSEEIRKIRKDLVSFDTLTSHDKYHDWIISKRRDLFPNLVQFEKNSINYHLQSDTLYFLYPMFFICNELEQINDAKLDTENHIPLFNVLPIRTSIVPKSICIDTSGLITNFIFKEKYKCMRTYRKENRYQELWGRFFNMSNRAFKKGHNYRFANFIRTDGVSISILFNRVKVDGKPLDKKD